MPIVQKNALVTKDVIEVTTQTNDDNGNMINIEVLYMLKRHVQLHKQSGQDGNQGIQVVSRNDFSIIFAMTDNQGSPDAQNTYDGDTNLNNAFAQIQAWYYEVL